MYFSKIVVIFALTLSRCSCQEVEFGGKEVITLDLTNRRIAAESNRITFRFKTINSFGMILYSKGTQGDYISIELVQGSLRWVSYHLIFFMVTATNFVLALLKAIFWRCTKIVTATKCVISCATWNDSLTLYKDGYCQ